MRKFLASTIILCSIIFPVHAQVSQDPLTFVEVMPAFQGGDDAMFKYIFNHLTYPKTARNKGIQGMVIAQFIVDVDSLLKDIKIIRGIGGGCDEEVLRMLEVMSMQKMWIPGIHNDQPVPVKFTMPVKFVLEGIGIKKSKKVKPEKV